MPGRIGIVGGVGPYASLHFYRRLLQLSGAVRDEDYPAAILVGEQIPSRVAHLLGRGRSPLPALRTAVNGLRRAGADVIAIPSATTHAYRAELAAESDVPFCDLIAETGELLRRGGLRRPLFLATEATALLRIFDPGLATGTAPGYLGDPGGFIDRVKRGEPAEPLRAEFTKWLAATLDQHPARPDCAVLGCTELSVIAPHDEAVGGVPVVDVTDVLARAALAAADHHGRENAR